ncbi:MAG: PEGA domain-containing protein [Bdellovibrionales bacterium]|nr:PEGA domain-containing protein [Bdellovibrionales bacterium]
MHKKGSYRLVASLVCILFLWSNLTYAQAPVTQKPVILVDHLAVTDEVQSQYPEIQRASFQAFYQVPQVAVVPPYKIQALVEKSTQSVASVQKDDDYLVKARKLLNEGVEAYQGLDFEKATKLLSESRDEWIRNLAHLRSNRDLLKAHLYLAMAYLAMFKEKNTRIYYQEQAQKELEKVVYLDAELKLSDRNYSPEVIKEFESVKQKVLQRSRVTLKVQSNIKHGQVYINGKLEGQTPLTLTVIPGTYFVLVEPKQTPAKPWTSLVDIKRPVEELLAQVQPLVDVTKEQNLFRIREGADQASQDVIFLQNRAKSLNADYVFLGKLERLDGFRLLGQLFDARTGEFSQVAFIQMGYDLADIQGSSYDLAQALLSQIRTDGYLVHSKAGQAAQGQFSSIGNKDQDLKPTQEPQKAKIALHKKWWFWAGIVAVGAAGYYAISSMQGSQNGDIQINNAGNF